MGVIIVLILMDRVSRELADGKQHQAPPEGHGRWRLPLAFRHVLSCQALGSWLGSDTRALCGGPQNRSEGSVHGLERSGRAPREARGGEGPCGHCQRSRVRAAVVCQVHRPVLPPPPFEWGAECAGLHTHRRDGDGRARRAGARQLLRVPQAPALRA